MFSEILGKRPVEQDVVISFLLIYCNHPRGCFALSPPSSPERRRYLSFSPFCFPGSRLKFTRCSACNALSVSAIPCGYWRTMMQVWRREANFVRRSVWLVVSDSVLARLQDVVRPNSALAVRPSSGHYYSEALYDRTADFDNISFLEAQPDDRLRQDFCSTDGACTCLLQHPLYSPAPCHS